MAVLRGPGACPSTPPRAHSGHPAATHAMAVSELTTTAAAPALRRPRRPMIRRLDDLEHLFEVVGEYQALDVLGADLAPGEHGAAQPVDEPLPVRRADED